MSQRNKKNNGKTSLPESDRNVVPASNISQAPIVNPTTTIVPPSPPKEEILPDPALVGKEEILPAIPALEPQERDPDGEPTKEEEEAADINDYKALNKLWKGDKLKDVYFGQQASLDRKGKKKYVAEQKLKPKTPEQPASMLPRQSLSVHRFLQYCNSDKAGNENKSIFLWHNVGSGKTFTSLIIALNSLDLFDPSIKKYSKKKQIVIIAPGGIFVNFENELKEKLNVKVKAGLTDDEKKSSPIENTEGFNDCSWTIDGKTSRSFKLIGYRYSGIVKFIKNNIDTYVNPLKKLFSNSIVIFDECHRLFRPIEPLIPTAEYFIDNGLLQNSMRCILMTGTPFNTSTTDMITMLTFMKCAVLVPPVDKKCSRIYPIQFISKTPRPTDMKEIVTASSFGILCSILNFFPGGSILLAANNWPNKIKAYMAILHEDWQKRGLKPEEGILELLGREMKSETLTPGLFDGINIDNKPNEGFAIANIEEFYKGLGFTEEIEGTIKETIEGFFKGSSSLVKIELSEIKKYKGNYGLICELLDTINTEQIPTLNLTADQNIIVIGKLYRYIKQLSLIVGVDSSVFDIVENYFIKVIKTAGGVSEKFVVENVTKAISFIFTHDIYLKEKLLTPEQLNIVMVRIDSFCFDHLKYLYRRIFDEIKNYCDSIKQQNPMRNIELDAAITVIISESFNLTKYNFNTLQDDINKELGLTNIASQGSTIYTYTKSGYVFFKDGFESAGLLVKKIASIRNKKTVNDSMIRDIESGDFVKAGKVIIVGGIAIGATAIVSSAVGFIGLAAAPYVLGVGGVLVLAGGAVSYFTKKELDDIKNKNMEQALIDNTDSCIAFKNQLEQIENNTQSEIETNESKIEEESENPQQENEVDFSKVNEEIERLKKEKKCQMLIRLDFICTELETVKNNFKTIFNKAWFSGFGNMFKDIDSLKQKTIEILEYLEKAKDKDKEAIQYFKLGAITGKASKNLTALAKDLLKELKQSDYTKNNVDNMNLLNTAIANLNTFLRNIDREGKGCLTPDDNGAFFGGSTKNLPVDIPELVKESYEKLEIGEYTNDINLISKQYKILAMKYHPDRCKSIEGESEIDKIDRCNTMFAELSNAYKIVSEYFEVKNSKYYSIIHNLASIRYSNDNISNLVKINTKMLKNSNDSKNIFDEEFSDDNDAIAFFNTMVKITTSDEFINFYQNNKSELDDIAFTTLPSSEWASTTKGVIDIYKTTFTEGTIDRDVLVDDIINSFTCEDNVYLLEPIVNQVKKFRPIPKLSNPGEKIIIDNFENYIDSNSQLKLITNYSETENENKVGGGLFDDNPIFRFVRGQKTVSGTMSIIKRIFDDESISYDRKYHTSYLVFMKSFSDYLDWNGKTLNPVALNLFYEYINYLKTRGYYERAIDLQDFENSFLENVNYDFFSTKGLFNFMFGGNGFGDSIKNMYDKPMYKNTNIDYKKLGDALKQTFSFIDVKMPQIIIGDHSKSGNYDREENMTAQLILEPPNHTIVTKKEKYNYPNSHTELMFVEYTFEQQLFFGEINCDPNPEKWWVKKILQAERGTPRNTMYRCIGNYSKDCDKYKAVFTGLKEIDLTNSENGNILFYPEWKLAYAVNNHILDDDEIKKARIDREKEYEIGGKGIFEFKLDDMIKKNNEEQIENMDEINAVITQVTNDSIDIIVPQVSNLEGSNLKGGANFSISVTNNESFADIETNFDIVQIYGDGNCLYRALQYGLLKKTDKGWEKLKDRIFREESRVLNNNKLQNGEKINGLTQDNIVSLSANNAWGGDMEIEAFLNLYPEHKVVIHKVDEPVRILCGYKRMDCDEKGKSKTIHLFNDNLANKSSTININHFDVLIPKPVAKPVISDLSTTLSNVASNISNVAANVAANVASKGEQIVSDAVTKGKEAVSNIEESLTKEKSDETSNDILKIENIRYSYSKYFFDCPKFRQILIQLILMKTGYMYVSNKDVNGEDKIGLIEQPHLTNVAKYNAEKTNKYGVEMTFGDGDYDLRTYQELAHSSINEADYYYLPIVWSCSVEIGLNNFGFWLSELGFKYITLHPDHGGYKNELKRGLKRVYPLMKKEQTEQIKQKFLNEFFESQNSMDTDALIEYFQSIPNIKESPICILLHPELVEGVDCVYNPSLIAMEPANTYGDYEQLCGRVLRTYPKGGFKPDATNPDKNPINKVIYQYSSYNSVNLKNIMDKQFFFGQDPEYFKRTGYDIFYKENKGILNNIYISVQQEKNKNKFFMENIVNNNDTEKKFQTFNELAEYYFQNGILPPQYKDAIGHIYDIFESFKNITEKIYDITSDISSIFKDISDEKLQDLIKKIQGKLQDLKEVFKNCYSLTSSLADLFSIKDKLSTLVQPIYDVIMQKLNTFGIKTENFESLESFKNILNEKFTQLKNIITEQILNFSIGKMKIPNITTIVEKFTNNNVNINVDFFDNLKSGEELADTFNTCVEYFKDMSSQFSSSGIIPEPPAEMKTLLQTYIFQETKDDNSDEIVTIFFNDDNDYSKLMEQRKNDISQKVSNQNIGTQPVSQTVGGQNISGTQVIRQIGGENEKLINSVKQIKEILLYVKPLFNTLENYVNKSIVYFKNGIQDIISGIQIPEEILQRINAIYEKFYNNEKIKSIVDYFSNIKNSIDTLYNLDYKNNSQFSSILDAVKDEENVNRLLELIKEKNTYLSKQLIYLRDIIYPVIKSIYNNKVFQTFILKLANAFQKINENPKIKNLRDKENAFTNSTMFDLTSKYLYNYALDKVPFDIDLVPNYERRKLLGIFGENGIGMFTGFITSLQNKIPPYFVRLAINDWTGNYDTYLAQYKNDLSQKLFKRKQLEFKLIKYENSEMAKLNREQFEEEKRIRDIYNKASPSFQIKGDNIDMIKLQIDKNMANLSSLAIENESPDLNKLMELRFVQQDIDIVKNYILQGEGEKEDLIGFTDLSQIENCINSIDGEGRSAALNAKWCDPLYPNSDSLCLNTSTNKPQDFVARTVKDIKDLTGGKKTIRKKIIKNRKTIKFVDKIFNKKTIKNKNKKHLKTFKNL